MSSSEQSNQKPNNFKRNVVFLWVGLIACIGLSSMASDSSSTSNNSSSNSSNSSSSSNNSSSSSSSSSDNSNNNNSNNNNSSSSNSNIEDDSLFINVETILEQEVEKHETLSLNYILKYTLPDGFREGYDLQSAAEIVLVNEINQESIIGDVINKAEFSKEEFFLAHSDISDVFEGATIEDLIDETTSENGKIISNKLQLISTPEQSFYYTINTIEFDDSPDEYVGFTGVLNREDPNKLILDFIDTIQSTSIDLNSVRTFKPLETSPQVTLTEGWRKYTNSSEHLYFKYDELKYMEMVVEPADEDATIENFFIETEEFLSVVPDMSLYLDYNYTIDDRLITTKVYQMTTDFSVFYECFTFIENPNDLRPIIISMSIETLLSFEDLQAELDSIIKSIKF